MISKIFELAKYKELIYYFAWRDLKVRYKQTFAGAFWVVLQPLVLMTIFSVFLSQIGRDGVPGVPYPIFLYAGLTLWGLFSSVLSTVSASVVGNGALIKKVYFPKIIPAISSVLVALVDFLVSFSIFLLLFIVFSAPIQPEAFIYFPFLVFITVAASLGLGLFFAALNVRFRDVKQALPFITQALFFLTPIIYPFSLVPENVRFILFANPMTGAVLVMRDAFFSGQLLHVLAFWIAITVSLLLLLFGSWFFFKQEPGFVDTV